MTTVRAIHTVEYSPDPVLVPTGKLDADGRVQFCTKSEVHRPGSEFQIADPNVIRYLLECGAIEVLDDGWDDVTEAAAQVCMQERVGGPSRPPESEVWPKPKFPNERWTNSDGSPTGSPI